MFVALFTANVLRAETPAQTRARALAAEGDTEMEKTSATTTYEALSSDRDMATDARTDCVDEGATEAQMAAGDAELAAGDADKVTAAAALLSGNVGFSDGELHNIDAEIHWMNSEFIPAKADYLLAIINFEAADTQYAASVRV